MEQPNNTYSCDPYPAGMFATRCVVEYTIDSGDSLEVSWYYKDSSDGIPQEVPSGSANIQSTSTCGLIKSEFMLPLADLDVGIEGHRYFCRISLDGKTINDSQEVRLHSMQIIGNVLPACGMNESVQSELKRRCIDPGPEPTTPEPTTTQPIPLSTSLYVSVTMISTLLPSATPESPDPEVDSGNGDGNTDVAGPSLSSGEEILIYIAIGVAIFLFIVVFTLVVCACLWNTMFRQSKYCTCYEL